MRARWPHCTSSERILGRGAVIGYATMLLFVGLITERAVRGRLLEV